LLQAAGLAGLAATLLSRWPDIDPLILSPGMVVAGFGQGLVMSPIFGVVLAGVPADRAGVGSGILATTQQTSLALGVALLGSLFLSLSIRNGFVTVLAVQILIAGFVALASLALPHPAAAVSAQRPESAPLPAEEAA
jgi:hypothetical protein